VVRCGWGNRTVSSQRLKKITKLLPVHLFLPGNAFLSARFHLNWCSFIFQMTILPPCESLVLVSAHPEYIHCEPTTHGASFGTTVVVLALTVCSTAPLKRW
jgi:hypothetical protein